MLNVHRLFKSRNKVLAVMFTQAIVESLYLNIAFALFGFYVRQFFSPVTSHKPLFTLSYISTTRAHCILDKTYGHVMHTGVHKPHPLA